MDIDEETLKEELNFFMKDHAFNGLMVSVKEIRKEEDWLGKSQYTLYLNGVVEEACGFDSRFTDGIEAIGLKYGIKVRIPSYYYSK